MNTKSRFSRAIYVPVIFSLLFAACSKDNSLTNDSTAASSAIAVAASRTSATTSSATSTDSVYVVTSCGRGSKRDTIAASALPGTVGTYLDANYSGYVFHKAFAVKNSSGVVTNYIVIIYYNDKPVAVQFDAAGGFVKVLEQREKGDLDGRGWHEGGRFCERNGLQRDTVALSALPASILTYMSANYPQDTLQKAFISRHDSGYVVISKNNGLFATIFTSSGTFVRRVTLPAPSGSCTGIAQSALPANVLSYLSATYPNYVFDKAFSITRNGALQGYVVIINSNNTKYAVRFDASGNFVSVRTIW